MISTSSNLHSYQQLIVSGFSYVIDDHRKINGCAVEYPEDLSFSNIVKINVGGVVYETRQSTLQYVHLYILCIL